MIFSLVMILVALVIAYFHYVQGFLSATLSAIFTIVAAAVAVGWHETVVEALLAGRYADQANAMALLVLFAVVYIVLRLVTDKLVYGNVRLPVIAEKVGAGVMGLVAGVIASGMVAFAAQSLPFGPTVAGYGRLPLNAERYAVVPPTPGRSQSRDSKVYDELQADDLNVAANAQNGMFLPVDDFMLSAVSYLSKGPLSGSRNLRDVHPDWLFELFGQRLGIEPAGKRVALNKAAARQVTVADHVTVLAAVPQRDGEIQGLRPMTLDKMRRPPEGRGLIVVVATFNKESADGDSLTRFSPGSVRLVANGKNYFPVGTLDSTGTLVVNKPDDYLFADLKQKDAQVAFVFDVDLADVSAGPAIRPGTFFEAKRLAREDMSGLPIQQKASVTIPDGVIRKGVAAAAANPVVVPAPTPVPTPAPTPAPAAETPEGRDVMPVP